MIVLSWHDLLPVIAEIYARHGAGCCWHVVLDDGNVEVEHRQFCATYAVEMECGGCIAATPLLLAASKTQLLKAIHARRAR